MNRHPSDPSVTLQVKFDAICIQFEEAWRQDEMPTIESYLEGASEAERPLLLPQLLLLELEYIEDAGTSPQIDAYLERFPNYHSSVRSAFKAHTAQVADADNASVERNPEGTVDQQPITERAGSQIGRYKLLEQIGEGGMGVVYMAEQQRPVRRKVALKIIKPGMDTNHVVARFEAERQALAMMDHPNIARVLDAGSTASGRPYFVMELVRGTTLVEYCDASKFNTNERLKLFKLVCQAVQHAHTKGIIHRDLKPTNVLVTLHDGVPVPKIIDFGVSKAMGQQLTEKTMFTAFAQMVGTPLYMSPEQAEMSGLDIDTRSDIYSLGVLLYELLTGVTPFDRQRLHTAAFDELRRIIREEEPDKPSTRVSSLGESSVTVSAQRSTDPTKLKQLLRGELDWIVMKALEKDRNRRYETANALVAEVDRYLSGEPVEACPPSTTYRLRKLARRYKGQVAVAASFLTLLLVSSVVAWLLYADTRRARNDAVAAKDSVTVERDRARDAEREASLERDRTAAEKRRADQHADELKVRLYDYHLLKAGAAYRDDNSERAREFLEDCLEGQRGWEWHYLRRLVGIPFEYELDVAAHVFAVSPADPLLAVGNLEGGIQLLRETDGRVLWNRATGNRFVMGVSFSPNGEFVAVSHASHNPWALGTISASSHGGLQLRATATGELIWEEKLNPGMFGGAVFSPDGRRLAVHGGRSTSDMWIQLLNSETGTEIWSEAVSGMPLGMVFSPDGQRLFLSNWSSASVHTPSRLECWSVVDHSSIWSVSRPVSSTVAITKDGSRLFTGGSSHSVQVWDAATGAHLEELTGGQTDHATSINLSRDERHLISRGHQAVTIWDWQTKQVVRTMQRRVSGYLPPTFLSSAEDYLLTLDSMPGSRIQFIAVDPLPPVVTLTGHVAAVRGVAFSPDGSKVLSTGFDGTLRTWDASSGQEIEAKATNQSLRAIAYSPNGDHIAVGGRAEVSLWSAETGDLVHYKPETRNVRSLEFSPDGRRLLASSVRDGLKLIDVATGRNMIESETPTDIHGAAFAADARQALSLDYDTGQIDLWNIDSGDGPQTIRPGTQNVHGMALVLIPNVADGQGRKNRSAESDASLVAAAINNTIELWDIGSAERVGLLRGHDHSVRCFAVSYDGSRLFSGDMSGVVKVWNLDTREQLMTIHAHEPRRTDEWGGSLFGVMSLALSPDERTLATTGADGLVKLWETTHPSKAMRRQREIVREATTAVNQNFERTSSRRAVFEALSNDRNLASETLKVALDVANVRGDLLDSERRNMLAQIPANLGASIARAKETIAPLIEHVRRDLELNGGSDLFVELVKTVSGTGLAAIDASTANEAQPDWFWLAAYGIIPALTLAECEQLLTPMIKQYPEAHQFSCLRGLAYAREGQWQQATEDLTTALERTPEKTKLWQSYAFPLALAHYQLGNRDRYHTLCEKLLSDFGDTADTSMAKNVAAACLISKHAAHQLDSSAAIAMRAMSGSPDGYFRWYSQSAGLAQYRLGNWQLAIEILEQAKAPPEYRSLGRYAGLLLVQACAYHNLGNRDRSSQLLVKAQQIMDGPDFNREWWTAIGAHAALDELQNLMEKTEDDVAAAGNMAERIVTPDSQWKWLHPTDGVDPAISDADFHTTFFDAAYDDSAWQTGQDGRGPDAGFGYGDPVGVEFDLPDEGHRKTAYFRHRFVTNQSFDQLILSLQLDDGMIVYLDGKEVGRLNVTGAPEAYELHASRAHRGTEKWVGFHQLAGKLEPGEHVLTISVHNHGAGSSDLRIAEISLWGTPR